MTDLAEVPELLLIDQPAQGVRDLLQDQDDPDGSQHALDDAEREELRKEPESEDTQRQLHQPGDDGRDQEGFPADLGDACSHDAGETRRGSADRQWALGDHRDHQTANHAGHETGHQRRVRCEGDAETQRQGDEEDHHAGRQVVAEVLQDSLFQGCGVSHDISPSVESRASAQAAASGPRPSAAPPRTATQRKGKIDSSATADRF